MAEPVVGGPFCGVKTAKRLPGGSHLWVTEKGTTHAERREGAELYRRVPGGKVGNGVAGKYRMLVYVGHRAKVCGGCGAIHDAGAGAFCEMCGHALEPAHA